MIANADSLISKALSSLDDYVLSKSLCGTAFAIVEFCEKIKKYSFNSYLKSSGGEINGWALSDAVWTEICSRYPKLGFYPLGNIAERTVRKTILRLCFDKEPDLNIGEKEILKKLRDFVKDLGIEGLLKVFLTEYFFEMCIDQNRRYWEKLKFDLGFWYNFTKKRKFVSLDEEKELRKVLEKQCGKKAGEFFCFLKSCLHDRSVVRNKQRIIKGFEKVFGIEINKREDYCVKSKKPFVNVVVGDISLSNLKKSFFVSKDVRRFFLYNKNPNVVISFDVLENFLGHEVHSLVKDLFDIGVVVYMADLYTKREINLKREISILMPVRHPFVWNKNKEEIEKLVSFLGRDNFKIRFVKLKEKSNRIKNFNVKLSKKCVCLFSGGLDTLSGAVWTLSKNLDPVFVSHYSSGLLSGKQKLLIKELEKKYGKSIKHLGMHIGKASGENAKRPLDVPYRSVMIQYLRSFLFLSLASAVALESKVKKIYVFENGPVTLNPIFSEARINTRTTHPHFLAGFRRLVRSVFGTELIIESPFLYKTKGEVVNNLVKENLGDLAKKTVSCWNWSRVPIMAKRKGLKKFRGRHDGICVPCIVRRASMNYTHLFKKDARYLTNVFTQFTDLNRQDKTMIADFLRFCKIMEILPNSKLLYRFPDLSLYEEDVDAKKVVGMYKRHAKEMLDCFRQKSNKKLKKLFSPVLKK